MESVAQAIKQSSNAALSLNHNKEMTQSVSCPAVNDNEDCCVVNGELKHIIIHINDEHKWSREDIADWLDTLENQPVFYPDIRTDDEKIEDAKKEQEKLPPFQDAIQSMENKLKSITAYGVNNPIAGAWVKTPQALSQTWEEKFLSDFILAPGPTQSGPITYKESTPISSYNTFPPQLTYGGLNAGSTVTLQYDGSTISGYVENIECHYSGYSGATYTVTFKAV